MGRPQASFAKRQREQARRERQQLKAEKRAQKKTEEPGEEEEMQLLTGEEPLFTEDGQPVQEP
ncbi:MAG: hypothetical protein JWN02_2117 [Acidobacteria bacterium]|jgi:sRNA-binding protein|nr:hypothetical protein [Acidobacteriota bacterium]